VRRELREGKLLLLAEYVDEGAEAVAYVRHTEVPNQEALIVRIEFRYASVQLDLLPKTAATYVPDDAQPHYAFFKPRILGGNWP
jgi:hypothetical protein